MCDLGRRLADELAVTFAGLLALAPASACGSSPEAERAAITKSSQAETKIIQDETVARLAEEYEKGAVLSFYFADQLKGIESAGFDLANFFPDMIASFDPVREARRPAEYAEAVQRAKAAREAAEAGAGAALAGPARPLSELFRLPLVPLALLAAIVVGASLMLKPAEALVASHLGLGERAARGLVQSAAK